jgi:hypothetical protein
MCCVCVCVCVWCTTRNTEPVKTLYKSLFRKTQLEFFHLPSFCYLKLSSI